jgi:type II secretory pathway pseudopilin PulG
MTGRRSGRGRDQAGVSMVEMVVVIGLLGLVLAMVFEAVTGYQRAAAGADSRQENLDQARTVMAVLTKDLRTARSFSALAGDDVTFLGLLDIGATAPPNQIRLYVDAQGVLREAVTPPDNPAVSPVTYTGAPTTRVVGEGLVDTANLLSFRDAADNPTTTTTEVASVVITLSVDLPAPVEVPPTVLSSRVFLPNVAAASGA